LILLWLLEAERVTIQPGDNTAQVVNVAPTVELPADHWSKAYPKPKRSNLSAEDMTSAFIIPDITFQKVSADLSAEAHKVYDGVLHL